jgi:hypothetical protein
MIENPNNRIPLFLRNIFFSKTKGTYVSTAGFKQNSTSTQLSGKHCHGDDGTHS